MADKIEKVVQFNVITDIQDAVTKTKQLQEFLNKLGVPEKLQSSFSKAFAKIEDAGAKAGAALARGLKDNKDINAFNTASKQIGDTWTHLTELLNKIPKDKLKDFFSASVKQQIDDINNSIKQTQTEIGAIAAKSIKAKNTKYQRAKAAVTTKLPGTVGAFESEMGSGDFAAAQAAITATSKLNKSGGFNAKEMRDLAAAMEYALKKAQNLAEVKQRLGIVDGQNAEIAKLYAQALAEGNAYIDAQTGELKQGAQVLDNMTQEQLGAAKAQNEMNQEMENFKNKITYFFGAANAINLLKRAARSAFATIKDLDKVMTEAAVVTNFSVGDMWSQLPEYTRRANELGVSVHDAYESATLFYQQGLKTNEVMAVSNETLKMARIAGLGAEDSTKRMTNALRGFNMEINEASAGRINDVYSALAAKAAANVDEISTAMTKVASLAKSAGMEFETTSAFLTQIIETTQESPETAGTALKLSA